MSKVVKKVGRAVSKVVKGVVKVVSGVVKGVGSLVKKIASSKIGKVLLTAAAVYFGGAALAGGFGSSAAGGSFLSGMGTGISNAASSLSSAWSSALSGNFSGAASNLSAGFQGTTMAAQNAAAALPGATTVAGTPPIAGPAATTVPAAPSNLAPVVDKMVTSGSQPGIIGRAWNGLGEYGKAAAVMTTGNIVAGMGQQKALEEQQQREDQMAQEARDRYNSNVGASLWGSTPSGGEYVAPGQNAPRYDPVEESRLIGERYRMMANQGGPAQVGMINRNLAAGPMTNNNFPVYNPYYYG